MHLFFDTETTGLPRNYKAPVTDLNNWPRLVQIAWLVIDDDGNDVKCFEFIIKPVGFTIAPEASKVHGITTEYAEQNGHDLRTVLLALVSDISESSTVVAHNMNFDQKIIGAEFLRMGLAHDLDRKPKKCTMESSTNYCKLPGPYGYKWPRLDELHSILFSESFDGAHSALADVRACARCYFELSSRGII